MQGEDVLRQVLWGCRLSRNRDMRVPKLVEPGQVVTSAHRHLVVVGVAVLIKKGVGCRIASLVSLLDQIMDRLQPGLKVINVQRPQALETGRFLIVLQLDGPEIDHHFLGLLDAVSCNLIHGWGLTHCLCLWLLIT